MGTLGTLHSTKTLPKEAESWKKFPSQGPLVFNELYLQSDNLVGGETIGLTFLWDEDGCCLSRSMDLPLTAINYLFS